MAAFKLKNKYMVGLMDWLHNLGGLTGREVRERQRFMGLIVPRTVENQTMFMELVKGYANLDEEGNPKQIMKADGPHFDVPDDKFEQYDKEYKEFIEEEFIVEINESNRKTFDVMKKIVLDTPYTFGPREGDDPAEAQLKAQQAQEYADWCKSFEEI